MVKVAVLSICLFGIANAQNFAPIAVQRPENGRPFEPASFRESVAKAIRDNIDRQKLSLDAPSAEVINVPQKYRPAPNSIPRIRVPIVAKRPVQHKLVREEAQLQDRSEENIPTTTTTVRPPYVVQRSQERQQVYTPIIPQTPQLLKKEEPRHRNSFEEVEEDQARSAQYSFSSNVDDGINDNQMSRSEARDGLAVTGMYSYSDGFFKRTVHYIADENGYRVTKEDIQPIGDGPQYNPDGRADVSSSLAGRYSVTIDDFKQSPRKEKERKRL